MLRPRFTSVIIIRLIATASILINPFWGSIIANIFDALDVVLWDLFKAKKISNYHKIDKLLDHLINVLLFITMFQFMPSQYLPFAIFLFLLRTVGWFYLLATGERKVLLITPNFFMYYAIFFAFIDQYRMSSILENQTVTAVLILILFAFNYSQEVVLHLIKAKPWSSIKSRLIKS